VKNCKNKNLTRNVRKCFFW